MYLGSLHRWAPSELRCCLVMFFGTCGCHACGVQIQATANWPPAEHVPPNLMAFPVPKTHVSWILAPLGTLGVALLFSYVFWHMWLSCLWFSNSGDGELAARRARPPQLDGLPGAKNSCILDPCTVGHPRSCAAV